MSQHTVDTSSSLDADMLSERPRSWSVLDGPIEQLTDMPPIASIADDNGSRCHLSIVGKIAAESEPERLATIIPFPVL